MIELYDFIGSSLPEEFFHLSSLKRLESFQINCSRLKCLPDTVGELQQLISLSIVDTGIEYLPAGVRELNYLEYLTVMDCPIREVPFASVEKVQGGRRLLDSSRDKLLLRLRRLTLWSTRITEISFGEGVCPNLQKLMLHSCDELVEVGALPTTLTSLSMRYCGALNRITTLSRIGYLPVGVRELNNLEELTVGDCPISEVSFANVEKVQGGRRLLDSSIHKCMLRLKRLELVKTTITKISFGEGVCPNLQQLIVHSCHDLVEVGALLTTLTSLDMRGCGALNRITGFSGTEYLPEVGVSRLNNLEVLRVHDCPIHEVPFAIVEKVQKGRRWLDSSIQECMFGLGRLELVKTRITEISFGEGVCPNLQTLSLHYCHDLHDIGALPTTLTSLDMRGCGALKKITGLSGLAKLLELGMRRCKEVKVLPDLQTLISMETVISLEWVGISKCDKMKNIRVLLQAADPESDIFEKLIELAEESKEEDYFHLPMNQSW